MALTRWERDELNNELARLSDNLNKRLAEFESMGSIWTKAYEDALSYQKIGYGSKQSYNPNIEKKNRFKTSWKRVDEETAIEAKLALNSLLHSEDFNVKKERETMMAISERINKNRPLGLEIDYKDINDFLQLQRSDKLAEMKKQLESDQVLDIMFELREKTGGSLIFSEILDEYELKVGEEEVDRDDFLRYLRERAKEVGGQIDFGEPEGKVFHKEFTEENLTFNENKPIGDNPLLDENGIDMFNVTEEDDIYTQEDKRRFLEELLEERAAQEALDERELRIQEKEEAMNAELRAREAELKAKEDEINEQLRVLMKEKEAFLKAFEEEMMKKIEEEVRQRRANGDSIIIRGENESDDSEFEVGDDLEMYDDDGIMMIEDNELFDPDNYTAEELAELEMIFGYPTVKDEKKVEDTAKDVEEVGDALKFGHPIEAVKDVNKIIGEAAGDVDKIMELAVNEVSDALKFDHPILAVEDVKKVEVVEDAEDDLTF